MTYSRSLYSISPTHWNLALHTYYNTTNQLCWISYFHFLRNNVLSIYALLQLIRSSLQTHNIVQIMNEAWWSFSNAYQKNAQTLFKEYTEKSTITAELKTSSYR